MNKSYDEELEVLTDKIDRNNIIIASRNYCNLLTMTRALGEVGYNIDVLRVHKRKPSIKSIIRKMKPEALSQYVNHYYECIADNDEEKVLKQLIEIADKNNRRLLIPADDYLAYIIDIYYDDLKEYYILPNINEKAGNIHFLMNKNEQKKLAALYGLPLLNSVVISSYEGVYEIPSGIKYPCFIKPNVTINSTKSKMKKCHNEEELIDTLNHYALKQDFEMLVEEYAHIKNEYSILGVSTKDVTIAPGIFKVIDGGNKSRKGITLMGETVNYDDYKNMIDKCCQFIHSLNYTGIFDVDFVETEDGHVYFLELNFRTGASIHVFTRLGINIPAIYADYMIKNKEIDKDIKCCKAGKRFINEKVLIEEYISEDIDFSKMKLCMKKADVCFIKDDVDIKPYQYIKKYFVISFFLRIVHKFRNIIKK